MHDVDAQVRLAAFDFLRDCIRLHGDVLPWALLTKGFSFHGDRVPLVSQQGIFKPRVMREGIPLSIRTSADGPYEDRLQDDGSFLYRYRGTDLDHRENVGLRLAMERRVPLVYFFGLVSGRYFPTFPVFVVRNDPANLAFLVQVDDALAEPLGESVGEGVEIRRAYVTRVTKQRLHQRSFRERVVEAYRRECTICRLRRDELLDAAHILPDCDPRGNPEVPNGLSMCKLHHAAFDRDILGIRPDLVVEVRKDVLDEIDGPMLRHGLQICHHQPIRLPVREKDRPKREYLEERYEKFRRVG